MRKQSQKQLLEERAIKYVRKNHPWLAVNAHEAAVRTYVAAFKAGAEHREEYIREREKITARGVKVCTTCGYGRHTFAHRGICGV